MLLRKVIGILCLAASMLAAGFAAVLGGGSLSVFSPFSLFLVTWAFLLLFFSIIALRR